MSQKIDFSPLRCRIEISFLWFSNIYCELLLGLYFHIEGIGCKAYTSMSFQFVKWSYITHPLICNFCHLSSRRAGLDICSAKSFLFAPRTVKEVNFGESWLGFWIYSRIFVIHFQNGQRNLSEGWCRANRLRLLLNISWISETSNFDRLWIFNLWKR